MRKEKREEIDKKISFSLENIGKDAFLYINYPFCLNHCCFCIYKIYRYNKKESDLFLKYYNKEVSLYKEVFKRINFKFKNIHIGGGTPNLVPVKSLINPLKNLVDFKKVNHFIIELFPGRNFKKYLDSLKKYPGVKVQLGVQTLNEKILKRENRLVSKYHILDCIKTLSRSNLIWSIDLIYGFEDEDKFKRDYLSEIELILKYNPLGFHLYSIRSEKFNKYYGRNKEHLIKKINEKDRFKVDISDVIDVLKKNGYKKIGDEWCLDRNINYARKTICYDRDAEMIKPIILGIGPGAVNYHRFLYYKNTRKPDKYRKLLDQNHFPVDDFVDLGKKGLYPIVCFLKRFRISSKFDFKGISLSIFLSEKEKNRVADFIKYLKKNGFKNNFKEKEFKMVKNTDYGKCLYLGEKYLQSHNEK